MRVLFASFFVLLQPSLGQPQRPAYASDTTCKTAGEVSCSECLNMGGIYCNKVNCENNGDKTADCADSSGVCCGGGVTACASDSPLAGKADYFSIGNSHYCPVPPAPDAAQTTALTDGDMSAIVTIPAGGTRYFSLVTQATKGFAMLILPCTDSPAISYFNLDSAPSAKHSTSTHTVGYASETNITGKTVSGPEGTPCSPSAASCPTAYMAVVNQDTTNEATFRAIAVTPDAGDLAARLTTLKNKFVQLPDTTLDVTASKLSFDGLSAADYTTTVIEIPAAAVGNANLRSVCGVESVLTKAKSQTKAVEESTNNNGAAKEKVTTFDNGVTTEEVTVPAQGRAVVDLATLALTGAARALSSECKLYVVEVKDKTGVKAPTKYQTMCSASCSESECLAKNGIPSASAVDDAAAGVGVAGNSASSLQPLLSALTLFAALMIRP